jgi:hypothetical protein
MKTCMKTNICEKYEIGRTMLLTCFEKHVSEVAFPGERIWNFIGNRLVEAYIRDSAHDTETGTSKLCVSLCGTPDRVGAREIK